MDEAITYIRCRNCGTHVPEAEAYGGWYCTRECAELYVACSTCGRFFSIPREKIPAEASKGELQEDAAEPTAHYCSSECAADYTERYRGNFREALLKASER